MLDHEDFAMVRRVTASADFFDLDMVTRRYHPKVTDLLTRATAAGEGHIFDQIVRAKDEAMQRQLGLWPPARHHDRASRHVPSVPSSIEQLRHVSVGDGCFIHPWESQR